MSSILQRISVKETKDRWTLKYEMLKNFIDKNKRYPSHRSTDNQEKCLNAWATNQRRAKKGKGKYKITEEKIKLLEILPNWRWEFDINENWFNIFQQLNNFIIKNGKYPSQYSKNKHENKLEKWVSVQRRAKRGKGTCVMTDDRIKLLESLPNWKW